MKQPATPCDPIRRPAFGQIASARIVLIVVVCFLAGVAITAFWFKKNSDRAPAENASEISTDLSAGTRMMLEKLRSPVEIRFYALLQENDAQGPLRTLVGRLDRRLREFKRVAGDNLNVTRFESWTEENVRTAMADGLQPLNLDQGNPAYVGFVVARGEQKIVLPQIAPEWEAAVEFDLSRAIAQVTKPQPVIGRTEETIQAEAAAEAEIKSALPNFDSLPLAEGEKILRERSLQEFTAAVKAMQQDLKQAQDELLRAQNSQSESAQKAALQQLQKIQTQHEATLREIVSRSQAQIEALNRLKQ